jgi:tetratricopeptide (TPR) repeat protein
MKIDSLSNQLRRVILLLAVTVILPTVCLLWFMSQAVKNAQLAARQKLITLYEERLATASQEKNQSWSERFMKLDKVVDQNLPSEIFNDLFKAHRHSIIVYDEHGKRIYPLISADVNVPVDPAEQFHDAWRLEFAEQKLAEAIELYEEGTQSNNTYVRLKALIGKARCLIKLGDMQQAIEACRKVALSGEEETRDTATLMLIANARLLLVQLLKPELEKDESPLKDHKLFQDALAMLRKVVSRQNMASSFLPSDQNMPSSFLPLDQSVFLAHRALDLSKATEGIYGLENPVMLENMMPGNMAYVERMMLEHPLTWQPVMNVRDDGGLTLAMIERFPTAAEFRDWRVDQFRQ